MQTCESCSAFVLPFPYMGNGSMRSRCFGTKGPSSRRCISSALLPLTFLATRAMSHALPHSMDYDKLNSNDYTFFPASDPFGLSGIVPGQQGDQHYGSPSSQFHPSAANPAYASPHMHATGQQQFQTPQQQPLFQRQAHTCWQPAHACSNMMIGATISLPTVSPLR